MQKVTIICTGKLKEKFYLDAATEYAKRLSRFCKLDILELPEEAVLETGGRSYYFIKREAVCMGSQLLYYTGVLKRLQEGSYEVDNGSGGAGADEAAG